MTRRGEGKEETRRSRREEGEGKRMKEREMRERRWGKEGLEKKRMGRTSIGVVESGSSVSSTTVSAPPTCAHPETRTGGEEVWYSTDPLLMVKSPGKGEECWEGGEEEEEEKEEVGKKEEERKRWKRKEIMMRESKTIEREGKRKERHQK